MSDDYPEEFGNGGWLLSHSHTYPNGHEAEFRRREGRWFVWVNGELMFDARSLRGAIRKTERYVRKGK